MQPPTLTLTSAARAALIAYMASITEFRPVASLVWKLSGSRGGLNPDGSEHFEFFGPHWSVGFSDAARFPESAITEIDGIPFVLDSGRHSSRLHGAALDYSNGEYVVRESAAA